MKTKDYTEYYYDNGNVYISIVEDDYVSIEFFPNNQSKESFESAEYNNVFSIKNILECRVLSYSLNKPSDITIEEIEEVREEVRKLIDNYLASKVQ